VNEDIEGYNITIEVACFATKKTMVMAPEPTLRRRQCQSIKNSVILTLRFQS
jgi:hypothetical protein